MNRHSPGSPAFHERTDWFASARHKGESTQQTSNKPWSGAQEPLRKGYAAAEQFILDRPTEFFPGSTVIPFAPETEAALGAQTGRSLLGSPLLGQAGGYTSDVLSGQYLSPESNPFLSQVADMVRSEVQPAVQSSYGLAGRTGTSPGATEAMSRGISRGLAPYLFGEYGRERGFQESAAARAPGLAREDYYDIDRLGQVGMQREGQAREELADQMARWEFAQTEPAQRAQAYNATIGGLPMPMAQTTRTSGGQNPLMGGLAGAAANLPFLFMGKGS